jgi:hypothetical protein
VLKATTLSDAHNLLLFILGGCVRDMVVGELLMASVEQEHEPVSHYKRRSMESEEEQLQQPIAPKKTTSTSVDYREISPRSDSISTDSLNIMSYPENQQPASGATQVCSTLSFPPRSLCRVNVRSFTANDFKRVLVLPILVVSWDFC